MKYVQGLTISPILNKNLYNDKYLYLFIKRLNKKQGKINLNQKL